MFKRLLPLVFILAAATLCAENQPLITEIGNTPWTPQALPKLIYGTDDRMDVYQETDPQRLTWAASTCALIESALVSQNPDGTYTVGTLAYRHFGLPACEDEPFANQPVAASCTGFMVGADLIATAGHCYATTSYANTYFIFGFNMLDQNTPVLTFSSDQVYMGVELVARLYNSVYDYAIVRVERTISAPGAIPLPLRRDGQLETGAHVGVIGHPSGLPTKLAFGNETVVRKNESVGFFVANLDSYGGNSGSPVINPETGLTEGILVRGDTDFISLGDCFVSNVVPNDGGRGEDVSKSTSFAEYVPEFISGSGTITLDKSAFRCSDAVGIELTDIDLKGAGTALITLTASGGDSENVSLVETASGTGRFTGLVTLATGSLLQNDGTLEALEGETITAVYQDASDGSGQPATVTASAIVDCTPPLISNLSVSATYGNTAVIHFTTSEASTPSIHFGPDCQNWTNTQSGLRNTVHTLQISGLTPLTTYYFQAEATDPAGNETIDDNSGVCYTFTTTRQRLYFTESFSASASPFDLANKMLTFIPLENEDGYSACVQNIFTLPSDPTGGTPLTLRDDSYAQITLDASTPVLLYKEPYSTVMIGSNGYLTFTVGDVTYTPLPMNHFAIPRISAFFHDFRPDIRGTVSWKVFDDHLAVTYDQIPEYDASGAYPDSNTNTFQIELFFNGIIRIAYLDMNATAGLTGLSEGNQVPLDYAAMDLSTAPDCKHLDTDGDELSDLDEVLSAGTDPLNPDTDGDGLPDGWELHRGMNPLDITGDNGPDGDPDGDGLTNLQEFQTGTLPHVADSDRDGISDGQEIADGTDPVEAGRHHSADTNEDYLISLSELLRVVQFFNSSGYHCQTGTEDGFSVGTGLHTCRPHDSDYLTQDWKVDLSELLRNIQFYNSGGYHRDLLGEDLYAPGLED